MMAACSTLLPALAGATQLQSNRQLKLLFEFIFKQSSLL
jgi:hypothetical protein